MVSHAFLVAVTIDCDCAIPIWLVESDEVPWSAPRRHRNLRLFLSLLDHLVLPMHRN